MCIRDSHTSDQHPWFHESRSSQDNPRREWYIWSDTDTRYQGTRIIFLDTEKSNWAWDPISKSFYWHRFFSHQPDLNYDNPAVREQMWLSLIHIYADFLSALQFAHLARMHFVWNVQTL